MSHNGVASIKHIDNGFLSLLK